MRVAYTISPPHKKPIILYKLWGTRKFDFEFSAKTLESNKANFNNWTVCFSVYIVVTS